MPQSGLSILKSHILYCHNTEVFGSNFQSIIIVYDMGG